jgi:hypothetical protein
LAVDDDQRKEDGQQRDHAPPEKMENFTVIVWLLKNRVEQQTPCQTFQNRIIYKKKTSKADKLPLIECIF